MKTFIALFSIYICAFGFIKAFITDDMYRDRLAMWVTGVFVFMVVFLGMATSFPSPYF